MPSIIHGDCLAVMPTLPAESFDAIVTDPPYGLGFFGRAWDDLPPGLPWARECLRLLKPGGHLLAFGGTRTVHRLTSAVEDAGFEIRDSIAWLYGSGFPKSLNISKAIDKAAGAEREIVGRRTDGRYAYAFNGTANRPTGGAAGTADAIRMGGFVADKALITVPATDAAKQWDGWGTALKPAFEIVAIGRKPLDGNTTANVLAHGTGALNIESTRVADGRWPANVILDESQAVELPESRYFYCPKASRSERPVVDGVSHLTVKPLALMRWLCRLVTPPGGRILDPFAGSGATMEAAQLEGFRITGIEREAEYIPLIEYRLARVA